jgi:hypothetical protein
MAVSGIDASCNKPWLGWAERYNLRQGWDKREKEVVAYGAMRKSI